MSFGYALKKLREARGLSLREFGKLCQVDYTYIHRLEREEKTAPSGQTLEAFIRALKMDVRRSRLLSLTLVATTAPDRLIDVFVEDDRYDPNLLPLLATMNFRGSRPRTKDDWRKQAERLENIIMERNQS